MKNTFKDYFFANVQTPSLYATHCLVKDMFPQDIKVLWTRTSNGLLVRSHIAPISQGATFIEREIQAISQGSQFAFTLNANACIQRQYKREDGTQKKFVHHIAPHQEDSLKVWLLNRCFANGFALMDLHIRSDKEPILRKEKLWEINYTRYSGSLIVTDADKFTNAVTNGVGRAKAFGAGLLTIS